jgi:hypothetical protein
MQAALQTTDGIYVDTSDLIGCDSIMTTNSCNQHHHEQHHRGQAFAQIALQN